MELLHLGHIRRKNSCLLNDNFHSTKKNFKLKKDFLRNLLTMIRIDNNSID